MPVTLWGKPVTFQGAWRRLYSLDYRELVSLTRVPLAPGGPPPVRFDGNSDMLGGVDLFSVAAAAKLTRHLSLGASFNFWHGDWDETHVLSATPLDAPSVTSFESVSQSSHLRGESFVLGMMLAYPRFSLGVVYQNPLTSDYSASASGVSSEHRGRRHAAVRRRAALPPRLGRRRRVAARPALDRRARLHLGRLDRGDPRHAADRARQPVRRPAARPTTSTRDTWSVNAGAERLFAGDGFVVPLRFGLAWEPQGARDPYTRDPVNFVMLALGTGYNTNSLKFDAAFQYRWASFESGADFGPGESSALLPSSVGERTNKQWRLKLSLILRLTDTDKLKRTAHKVFG